MKIDRLLELLEVGTSIAAIVIGQVFAVAAFAYLQLSAACMRMADVLASDTLVPLILGALLLFLLTGMAVAGCQAVKTRRTLRSVGRDRLDLPNSLSELMGTVGLAGRVDLVAEPEPFAFCYGLRRPRILLSDALLQTMSEEQLQAVLRHEAVHLRQRDPLRILLARSVAFPLGFIPLTRPLLQAYLCRLELQADRDCIVAMGDVRPLAGALQRMVISDLKVSSLAVGALSATDIRIDQLLGEGPPSFPLSAAISKRHLLGFTLAVALVACVSVAAAYAPLTLQACLSC